MVEEARLEDVGSGLAPVSAGWFVVNVRDAAWVTNDVFGAACIFEGDMPARRRRPDLEPHPFDEIGFKLAVIQPGQSSGLYHAESNQEDFLVLAGECVLVIENEERHLHAWDFVHCPPGTAHVFVGAGTAPCLIFMTGGRTRQRYILYASSELARSVGAGVETETSSPKEGYAPYPHWQPERPDFAGLPWA